MNSCRLKREIGLGSAIILVIANMIGTGIFTTSGFIMESLQDPQIMLFCWVIGGLFALSGALCYGELGALFPRAGGEYVFLRESFGRRIAFLSGWISLIVGFSAPIAAASIAFAGYFFRSLPNTIAPNPEIPFLKLGIVSLSPVTILAVGIILLFSLVHCYGLSFGTRVQNILTIFKILIILGLISLGLTFGNGSFENFGSRPDFGIVFSKNFTTSLIFITFAYSGWNAASYLGGEIKQPSKNIPYALIIGTLIVVTTYLLLNMTFIYALPVNEMSGVIEVGAKSATSLFGSSIGKVFSFSVALGLMSLISAMILAGPRVYYAMAKDGVFMSFCARTSNSRSTPVSAILLQAAIAIGITLTSSFDKLLLYIGFTLSLFAVLTVIGMMLLRFKKPHLERPYKTFGYPITPILFISGNLWIIVFSIMSSPMVTIYAVGTIIIGNMIYSGFWSRTSHKQVDNL